MWKAISEEFPNALTTDSTSIKEALLTYGRMVGRGEWMLRPEYYRERIHRMHTRIIIILAEVGKSQGHDIWIGRREQGDSLSEGFAGRDGELRQYVSRSSLGGLDEARNIDELENVDVLWLRGSGVVRLFEIESTTSMTEALKRGSNLDSAVPKYLVIPQGREDQLLRKLRSPLFSERFEHDSWQCLFFEALEQAFQKPPRKVDVEALVSKKLPKGDARRGGSQIQLGLFVRDHTPESDSDSEW
jgi:hypothetical protein